LADGLPAFALFAAAGLAASNGEARRLIRGGGARLDDVVITDEGQTIRSNSPVKLSAGKKQHVMVTAG
jgi:tyrosyl-tRNA synthetase